MGWIETIDWIQWIAVPLFGAIFGGSGWLLRSRIEEFRREQEKLRSDRRRIYTQLLEPYILMFSGINSPDTMEEARQQIISFEHRKVLFEINLVGSDSVAKAFNDMMQYFYRSNDSQLQQDPGEMMLQFGNLLLAIRREFVGKSKMSARDMLRSQINDIDRFLPKER